MMMMMMTRMRGQMVRWPEWIEGGGEGNHHPSILILIRYEDYVVGVVVVE